MDAQLRRDQRTLGAFIHVEEEDVHDPDAFGAVDGCRNCRRYLAHYADLPGDSHGIFTGHVHTETDFVAGVILGILDLDGPGAEFRTDQLNGWPQGEVGNAVKKLEQAGLLIDTGRKIMSRKTQSGRKIRIFVGA